MVSILRPDEINARSEASEWHTPSDQPLSDHSQPVPPEDQSQAGGGWAEARQQSDTRPRLASLHLQSPSVLVEPSYVNIENLTTIQESPGRVKTGRPPRPRHLHDIAFNEEDGMESIENLEEDEPMEEDDSIENLEDTNKGEKEKIKGEKEKIKEMCQKNKASFEVDHNTLFMINERLKLIDDVNLKIKILNEVLDNYDASTSNTDEKELVAELGEACKKVRPNIHQVTMEMEEGDESIREFLLVSDELNRVLDRYRVVSETTPEVIDLDSTEDDEDDFEDDFEDWTEEEWTEAINIANQIEKGEAMEEDEAVQEDKAVKEEKK